MSLVPISSDVDVPSGSKPQRHDGNDEDDGDDDNDDIMDTSDKPSSSSGTKRQQCHEENPGVYAAGSTPPSKRPKPMGKYGAKSNLKSDNHRTKFAHPVLTKERKEVKTPISGEEGNVSDGDPESLTCYAGGAQLGIYQCLLWLHHMYTCHSVIVCRNDCMACPESLACYAIQMNVKL